MLEVIKCYNLDMKMLRQWNGDSHQDLVEMLGTFDVHAKDMLLIKFEILSPDSFIWYFACGDERYCLYAEDFVHSLEDVLKAIHDNLPANEPYATYELVAVKKQQEWSQSSPVQAADFATPPENTTDFMKYAATSGLDFVFLARSIY